MLYLYTFSDWCNDNKPHYYGGNILSRAGLRHLVDCFHNVFFLVGSTFLFNEALHIMRAHSSVHSRSVECKYIY